MLVSTKEMLLDAKKGKYAIGQFNINNLEFAQAILLASEELKSPVILGVSESAARYMGGFNTVFKMVEGLILDLNITIPVALHLDHGSSFEICKKAIDSGFTSVMIDGSKYPIDENIKITKEVVSYAHPRGVSVEAEVGVIGGSEDDIIGNIKYATLEDSLKITKEANIDALAPALGTVHGLYKNEPKLGFDKMKEISEITNLPLVLHGATGLSDEDIKKAIKYGTTKINVNTENQIAWTQAIRKFLNTEEKEYDPRKINIHGKKAIEEKVKEKIILFGSQNKK
ncbi:MAG TPA: class II fructose-1,6-bisphosphate aldolase [Tenericutes bacterium]|nr:class II fructose-1,6-bisphosphate aldolase [Mycoplasmatota bacterium]